MKNVALNRNTVVLDRLFNTVLNTVWIKWTVGSRKQICYIFILHQEVRIW